jgi:hypothetical protein
MNDDPMAMANRLSDYVDQLLAFRRQGNQSGIEGKLLMIKNVLNKLRQAYAVALFPPGIIERIRDDIKRADLPELSQTVDF